METNTTGRAFADASGIAMTAEFVPQSQSRNKGGHACINWRVTLTKSGHSLTVDYSQGIAHLKHYQHRFADKLIYSEAIRSACERGKNYLVPGNVAVRSYASRPVTPPALTDVLYSLVLDSDALQYATFEDWAAEFGYDEDSRKGEAIYRACLATALKLRQMVDLDAAREAFCDY